MCNRIIKASILALGLVSIQANATSVVNSYSQNGLALAMNIEAGYVDASTSTVFSVSDGFFQVFEGPASGGPDRSGSMVSDGRSVDQGLPPAGAGTANATGVISFSYGGVLTDDSFSFDFSGVVSALSAANAAGDPLDGFAKLNASMQFSVDLPPGSVGGANVGIIHIAGIDPLAEYEFAKIIWTEWSGAVSNPMDLTGALLAGTDVDLGLIAGYAYSLDVTMGIYVPNGIDPAFNMGLTGSVQATAVPVMPAVWLFASGLLAGLAVMRLPCGIELNHVIS